MITVICFFGLTLQGAQTPPSKKEKTTVNVESSYIEDAEVSGGEGRVSVIKNHLQIEHNDISLGYSHWKFDWDNVASLPFGDGFHSPITDIHSLQAALQKRGSINDEWSYFTFLSLKSTFEKEMEDSYGVNLLGLASYRIGEDHSFQMGGFANYHPTKSLVLPAISYAYRERSKEGWQLILGFPKTHIGYHIDQKSLLRVGVIFSQTLVRLSDDSVIEKSGYVEAKDTLSNIGITHQLIPSLSLSADVLYTLKREFTIYDANANEMQSHTIKNGFGGNVKMIYRF